MAKMRLKPGYGTHDLRPNKDGERVTLKAGDVYDFKAGELSPGVMDKFEVYSDPVPTVMAALNAEAEATAAASTPAAGAGTNAAASAKK